MAMPPSPAPVSLPPENAAALEGARAAARRLTATLEREARAAGPGSITLVAITSFTIVDDPDRPEGRAVNAGEEFTVSLADLPRYAGRGRLMAEAG